MATVLCNVGPYSNRLKLERTAVMVAPDVPEILNSSEFVLLGNFTLRIVPTGCNYFYGSDTVIMAFNPIMSLHICCFPVYEVQ